MVTYFVRRKINQRFSQIIHQDKQRNYWTSEKLARKTGFSSDQIKTIKESPATVPCHDLYQFFGRGLDSKSWNEFTLANMELQIKTSILRNQFYWLIKIERGLVAYFKKSGPLILGVLLARLIWDLISLWMRSQ